MAITFAGKVTKSAPQSPSNHIAYHQTRHYTEFTSIMHDKFSGSEAPNKVRMMVFETDEPHPDTEREKGSFGQVFDKLFKIAGDNHDPPLGIETAMKFVVEPKGGKVPSVDDLKDVHAILITGNLWQHRPDIRFSGVCFGHQILCRMLGAKVDTVPGGKWELSHTHLDLSDVGKQLFRTNNEKLRLHQMHQDHVVEPPSSKSTNLLKDDQKVHVWGSSEHTAVQGIYIKDRLFTSQGHLGFDEDMVKRQIELRVESGSLKDLDHAEAAKETADMEHDGEVVAASILRLFHGDDNDIP
ncbi:class I glutamine amidotransferase-like protein [Aureobasidium pullulans]|uniref:Class I glutamine amidotransferase-like protein n=1 Tax=Aureobasidium pullulans TaxID=5580 RepID=A0A4S9LMQ3_AURPU|nr:class I glutamine amidotransferase-like protein [Aureobasidium pullulans]